MPVFVNYNGTVLDASQPVLMYNNRAFRYGDAVFETIRLMNGEILFFEKHLARLKKNMHLLGMNWHDDFNFQNLYLLIRHLDQVNELKGNGRIRFQVFRKEGGYYTPQSADASFLIEAEPMESKEYKLNETGLKADFFEGIKKPLDAISNIKSSNALCFVLAGIHKQKTGLDECFICNTDGNVAEAISANIFMVKKGEVFTPSLGQGCVAGVMREVVMDILKQNGKKISEAKISVEALLKADEIFLTNVTEGVRWVQAIRSSRFFNAQSKWLVDELNKQVRAVASL